MSSNSDYMKGVFLLVLAVSGNFVAESLGCKTQKLLKNSMAAKHIILISIIYFAINFTSQQQPPLEIIKKVIIIWVFFLLFAKMHLPTTIAVFSLMSIAYITTNQIDYYEKNNRLEEKKKAETLLNVLLYVIAGTVIIGFSFYARAKYKEYKGTFNVLNFIFGKTDCKSHVKELSESNLENKNPLI